MRILIKNGRVIDPKNKKDETSDIFVENGVIVEVSRDIDREADKIIDANGKWVAPGLIDIHVHLRQPGLEHKEDIFAGSRAAALGGFSTICAMPNTKPVTDCTEVVEYIYNEAKEKAAVNILVIGSVTKGQKGIELSPIKEMAKAGICAISEDGFTVMDEELMTEALKVCKELDLPMFSHCEDLALVDGGVINLGLKSKKYGLKGISDYSEEVIEERDIKLAQETGARLHLCHVSTKGGIKLIKEAKASRINVTAEATPHHFALCDEDILENDGKYKMNPPLRSREDKEAIICALRRNVIEVIATDHAPHHETEKEGGFEKAANGIVGLETALGLCVTELVMKDILTPYELIEKLTVNPAKVIGLDKGSLSVGAVADIVVIDSLTEYTVDASSFVSKGKNTPFDGWKLKGRAQYLLVDGEIVVEDYKLTK